MGESVAVIRGGGHVDVAHAEVADGVDDGRLHRRGGADGAALADALGAQCVDERRRLHVHDLDVAEFGGRDHGVVGEVRRDGVAVAVVAHFLEQRLGGALGYATVDLALEQHRVQHPAGIVAGDLLEVLHLTGLGVDLDHGHVGTEREGGAADRVVRGVRQAFGQFGVALGGHGDVGPRPGDGGSTRHVEAGRVLVEHHVGLVGLEHAGGNLAGLVDQVGGGEEHGIAALLQRARAHRALAQRDEVGVAPHDVDLVHRDTGLLVGEHAPRRDVALTVGRGAGVDDRAAVVEHLDLGVLAAAHTAGDLDVHAHADTELLGVARCPAAGLLGTQRRVVGGGERLVERALVVAHVVGLADLGGERLGELADEVHATHLGRVFADLGGEQVHRPLGGRSGLGTAGTAVGGGERGVGDHAGGAALDVGDVVHGARHRPGHERGEDGAHLGERARVLQCVELVVGDLAVAGATDGDVLHLGATVAERHHAFAAGLAPAQRATDALRQHTEQRLFGVAADLGAEAAAHIGGDDEHLVGLDAIGADDGGLRALGSLGAEPLVQATIHPGDGRAAHFERAGRNTLVHEAVRTADHFAALEERGAAVLGHAEHGGVEHDVAAGALVDEGAAGHRLFHVDHGGQSVDVDDDGLGGVFALIGALGDDGRNGLADVAHLVDGQQTTGHHRVERRRHRLQLEIGGGEDGDDARLGEGVGHVDAREHTVGHCRAYVRDVCCVGERRLVEQVVDVHAAGGEELRIFLAQNSVTQDAAGHVKPPVSERSDGCEGDTSQAGASVQQPVDVACVDRVGAAR
jgi:hypothetical protein